MNKTIIESTPNNAPKMVDIIIVDAHMEITATLLGKLHQPTNGNPIEDLVLISKTNMMNMLLAPGRRAVDEQISIFTMSIAEIKNVYTYRDALIYELERVELSIDCKALVLKETEIELLP